MTPLRARLAMPHPIARRTVLGGLAMAALPLPLRAQAAVTVVATTGMIADTAAVIGGDAVALRGLIGPGIDPHAYRQTAGDIAAMAAADLILWNGLSLEAQMAAFPPDPRRSRREVAVAEGVPPDRLLADAAYPEQFDPHVWMDPTLWIHVISAILDALSDLAPDRVAHFVAAAEALTLEAVALDLYAREVLDSVPPEARLLVSAHGAFGYLGRAYGFEVLGLQAIPTESGAGAARVAEVVQTLVDRRIGVVFGESSVSDRGLRAVIDGAAAQGHAVRIGGELFSDATGAAGRYDATWLGMIDHNVTTIARALGGTAPEGGRLGRLSR